MIIIGDEINNDAHPDLDIKHSLRMMMISVFMILLICGFSIYHSIQSDLNNNQRIIDNQVQKEK